MVNLVIDNGSGWLRAGLVGASSVLEIPNVEAKYRHAVAYGKKIELFRNGYMMNKPLHAGLLVDTGTQARIWRYALGHFVAAGHSDNEPFAPVFEGTPRPSPQAAAYKDLDITVTETYGTPPSVYVDFLQILFEEFGVNSVASVPACVCDNLAFPSVIDEHVIGEADPVDGLLRYRFAGKPLGPELGSVTYELWRESRSPSSVPPCKCTINVGYTGAFAACHLRANLIESSVYRNYTGIHAVNRELEQRVSLRSVNLANHDILVDRLRRSTCYVANDTIKELIKLKSSAPVTFDLDEGAAAAADNTVRLGCERVTVCEKLFKPSRDETFECRGPEDRGVCIPVKMWGTSSGAGGTGGYPKSDTNIQVNHAVGCADLTVSAIMASPPILQRPLTSAIVVAGHGAEIPGFTSRLYKELRASLPETWPINLMTLAVPRFTTFM